MKLLKFILSLVILLIGCLFGSVAALCHVIAWPFYTAATWILRKGQALNAVQHHAGTQEADGAQDVRDVRTPV